MGVCQLTVVGNLGKDPETRDVGDTTVTSFSVAHNHKEKGEDVTDWYNVDAWGKLGELCARYLARGRNVCVSGQLKQRPYETDDGDKRVSLDIRATDVHFMGGNSSGNGTETAPETPANAAPDDDDDIPF